MSWWTHIIGTLYVNTGIKDKNIKERVEEILQDAPKITGSERNADIFVNVLSGHNTWTSRDCNSCEYGKSVVYHDEGGFSCESGEDFECPTGEYQTWVVITIVGDLRDREVDRTKREYRDFYKFVKSKFLINDKTVKIIG